MTQCDLSWRANFASGNKDVWRASLLSPKFISLRLNIIPEMSHLLFWPTIIFFYPIGNTSAVCLTEDLPPECNADVLLLACGDFRHILYTIHVDETNPLASQRSLDITCCDIDPAILARNALLFTFLADDGVLDKLESLWNLFYHMFIDQHTLSMLLEQCRKLVALSQNVESWRAGPYGHLLATCDTVTLDELRCIWTSYLKAGGLPSKEKKAFEQRFTDGMKVMSQEFGIRGASTAGRSAGPLAVHAHQVVSGQFDSYWASGTTDGMQGQKRRLTVNPTFVFSVDGDNFSVHYGTDPLSGFHLAEAYTSEKSILRERIPAHELVRVAKGQFSRWCTSTSKRLKRSNTSSPTLVIRMFCGDVLMFSQALKYCEVTQSPATPYNVAAWRLSTITLDNYFYGRNALKPAPLSFNVIDTSNISDHAGILNVLVVTAPLLRKTPSATLFTEWLLRKGEDPSQDVLEHICGDLPTMALLLGIIPSAFLSQFNTRSNVHEAMMMGDSSKQYRERLAWKTIGLRKVQDEISDDNPRSPLHLVFLPEQLAAFLFRVYLRMFADEDTLSQFQKFTLSPKRILQHSNILHYNRRSFGLFIHYIKTRVQTDWWRTMNLFEDLVLADNRLMMGSHGYSELCCQLHLLEVYTSEWIDAPPPFLTSSPIKLFREWDHIPQVVTIVLVVPRDAISKLEPDFRSVGTLVMQCDMNDGPRQHWFAVTTATFGTLRVSGTGEHRTGVVVGDAMDMHADALVAQPPWRSHAPLIITFSVPSASLMDFAQNSCASIGLTFRPNPVVSAKFVGKLGYNLTVYRTRLTDAERVFVLARCPVVSTSTSTGTGVEDAVLGDHWQEKAREKQTTGDLGVDADQGTTGDVHVQMDDKSFTVRSFTVRVEVADPEARTILRNPETVPTVTPGSDSRSMQTPDACVKIGSHTWKVRFPIPVDMARVKLRVARQSSYIEVIVPPSPFDVRPECDISHRIASLYSNDHGILTLESIHRINLDCCPEFKLPDNMPVNWCNVHVNQMYSEQEKRRLNEQMESSDTLLRIKQTLHSLLCSAAGMKSENSAPGRVFALVDTSSRVPYLYIIVSRMCLDVASHTIVADAFVVHGTPAVKTMLETLSRNRFASGRGVRGGQGHPNPDDASIQYILSDADETAAWFDLLPRLTERCRTWPHKATCEYRTSKQEGSARGPLCTCGTGIGTDGLPNRFKQIAPHLTRAALSPLFSVPYLKEADVVSAATSPKNVVPMAPKPERSVDAGKDTTKSKVKDRCRSCGKEGGMACGRCKRVRYCSKECQHADWKMHKKDCTTESR